MHVKHTLLQHFNVPSYLISLMVEWSSQVALLDQQPLIPAILVLYCKVIHSECAWRMRLGLDNHLPVSVSQLPFQLIHSYSYIICAETTCPDLPDPVDGIVDIQDNTPGGSAIYLCDPGLSLIGSSRRICNVDGTWSGEPPTCIGGLKDVSYSRKLMNISKDCQI